MNNHLLAHDIGDPCHASMAHVQTTRTGASDDGSDSHLADSKQVTCLSMSACDDGGIRAAGDGANNLNMDAYVLAARCSH